MQEKTLFEQWIILYKRKWEIFIVTAITAATALILSVVIDPIYEASLICYPPLQPSSTNYLSTEAEKSASRSTPTPLASEDKLAPFIGLLKSKKIAERVSAKYPEMTVTKLLRSNMDFEVTNEYLLKLYARANTPELAADVANAYFDNLNLLLNEASMNSYSQDEAMLRRHILDVEGKLAKQTADLVEYERTQGFADIDKSVAQAYTLLEQMNSELDMTRVQIRESQARAQSLRSEVEKAGLDLKTSLSAISTPYLEHLRIRLRELTEQLTVASFDYGPKHERYLALKDQVAETERKISGEVDSIIKSTVKPDNVFAEKLRQDMVSQLIEAASLEAKAKGYQAGIDQQKEKLGDLPAVRHEWQARIQSLETLKNEAAQLKKDLREMELQKTREMKHLVLVDPASPPATPAFPIIWLNLVIGIIVGSMSGIFYAYLLEYTKNSAFVSARSLARDLVRNE